MDYQQLVRDEATSQGLDPNIAVATMLQESGGDPTARSPKGAVGLMQLVPKWHPGVNVDDPVENVKAGVAYLKQNVDKYGVAGGLAAYNSGPTTVANAASFSDLPAETRAYVPKIMNHAAKMSDSNTSTAPSAAAPTMEQHYAALAKAKAAGDAPAVAEITGNIVQMHQSALQKATAAGDQPAMDQIQGDLSQLGGDDATQAPADAQTPQETPPGKPADYSALGKTLYKAYHGEEFKGSDQDAADWAKTFASDSRWNTATLAKVATTAHDWTPEAKQAYLDLQDGYDKEANFSGDTLGRVGKSILTDPVTYAGLGIGKLWAKGGAEATQVAVRGALEKSLARRVVDSTAGKAAIEGGVIGGGQDALKQTGEIGVGSKSDYDAGELGLSAGLGGGIGAIGGKIADRLSGISAVKKLAANAGSEEGAKVDSEIINRLSDISDNPNFRGQPVRAEQLNGVANSFIRDANDGIAGLGAKEIAAQGGDAKAMRGALQNWKALSESDIQGLRGTPLGESVADSIVKAQRTRSLTAEQEASGGISKLARSVSDVLPIPAPVHYAMKSLLGGAQSRKSVTDALLSPSTLGAARRISTDLGPSAASGAANSMRDLAVSAAARQAVAPGKVPAKRGSTELEKLIAKAKASSDGDLQTAREFQQGVHEQPIDMMANVKMPTPEAPAPKQSFFDKFMDKANASSAADMQSAQDMQSGQVGNAGMLSQGLQRSLPQDTGILGLVNGASREYNNLGIPDGSDMLKNAFGDLKNSAKAKTATAKATKAATTAQEAADHQAFRDARMQSFLGGGMPDGLDANTGAMQALRQHVAGGSEAQHVASLRDLANQRPEMAKHVLDALTPGKGVSKAPLKETGEKPFWTLQNALQANHGKAVPDAVGIHPALAALSAEPGALSAASVDAQGAPIRSMAAYKASTTVRQKVYDKVAADISERSTSKGMSHAATEALHELKHGSPRNAEEVLAKVDAILAKLQDPQKIAWAKGLLAPALRFYRNA